MGAFDQETLEHLKNSEHLDETIKVVNIKGWISLMVFIFVSLMILVWSLVGKVPITVSGKGLISAADAKVNVASEAKGVVSEIKVSIGDSVKTGEPLIVLQTNEKQRGSDSDPGVITSPTDGIVSSIEVHVGDHVSDEETVVSLQKKLAAATVRVLGFLPLYSAQQVKAGMKTRMGFFSVSTRQYGMLKGKVVRVLNYPADLSNHHLEKIPSESLKKYLVSGSTPTKIVIIKPQLDPKDPILALCLQKRSPFLFSYLL